MAFRTTPSLWQSAILLALAAPLTTHAQPAPAEGETLIIIDEQEQSSPPPAVQPEPETAAPHWTFGLDQARVEAGAFVDDGPGDTDFYGNVTLEARWDSGGPWEVQAAPRIDAYRQNGDAEWDRLDLDYGESFLRWRTGATRVTIGAQTVIWGRIDELPPSDRLSVQDLTRGPVDDLPDRRRAAPLVRIEHGFSAAKLDLVWLPAFRGAELSGQKGAWYPVDQRRGEALGMRTDPQLAAVLRTTPIEDQAPDGDGGFGARLSATESAFDFALTVQNNRQSTPYFRFAPAHRLLVAEYPRSWVLGGDLGFEAGGATWRLEAAYLSDLPVTARDSGYTTIEALNWGAGVEFYPGDGDTRLNLQLVGTNFIDAPEVMDREDPLVLNGSLYLPFDRERWAVNVRFFIGLDAHDLYLNPKLSYLGWEPHQLYVQLHWFEGSEGTLGGYYRDNSVLSAGWRAEF